MNTKLWSYPCALVLAALTSCTPTETEQLVDYVNPLVGTDTWKSDVNIAGHEDPSGYTFPGVTEPFGTTEWTAHTLKKKTPRCLHNRVPYWYHHPYISGFLGTHYPSGAVMFDYGAMEIMPIVGALKTKPEERASHYTHEQETSKAYKYSVLLDDYNVHAEMAATQNASIHKYTFPASDSSYVVVDAMPNIFTSTRVATIDINPGKREVTGQSAVTARSYRTSGYFVVQFDKDFDTYGTFNHNAQYPEVVETEYLSHVENGVRKPGLKAVYTRDDFKAERIDEFVDFDWAWYKPIDGLEFDRYHIDWSGQVKAPATGEYKFGIQTSNPTKLYINGKLILQEKKYTRFFDELPKMASIKLEKDKLYDIRLVFNHDGGDSKIKLSWLKPTKEASQVYLPGNKHLELATKIGAYLQFKTKEGETVHAKIGTSFISVEQARYNLEHEIPNWDIDEIAQQTAEKWNDALKVVTLDNCSDDQKTTFYTAMYHSMLVPRNLSEHGKYRSPYDGKVYTGTCYTDYSLWDTYRAEHPLLVLLKPSLVPDLITGLLNGYDQGGWMPKWPNPGYTNCMYGTHADAVISDAYVKGIRGFDIDKAEEAMLKDAYEKGNYVYWGRWGIEDFNTLGYVPVDVCLESVARTMEFSSDDYAMAQFFKARGDNKKADTFYERSQRFKNVLDDETKLARAKNRDGSWCDPNDGNISLWSGNTPKAIYNYKKNYTIGAPHNVSYLIDFLGGDKQMVDFMDELFDDDIYYVGDEFSMHAPYIYNFAKHPWKTQKVVHDIVTKYYLPTPSGLPGNDDCGQLSAWYMFSAMGFYPFCPGSTVYQIGTPCLPEVTLNLENGKTFHIEARNLSDKHFYIKSATLNGTPLTTPTLDHKDILNGGTLIFEMTDQPTDFGL